MLKHLFYLPGYLVRYSLTIGAFLSGFKNMGASDGLKLVASYTETGLVIYSVMGWFVIGSLVLSSIDSERPEPLAMPRVELTSMADTKVAPHLPDQRSELTPDPQLAESAPVVEASAPSQQVEVEGSKEEDLAPMASVAADEGQPTTEQNVAIEGTPLQENDRENTP